MSWTDLILALTLFGFVWGGFWAGLIQSIGGLVGLFLAEILATRWYLPFSKLIAPVFNGGTILSQLAAFLLLFLLITKLVGLAFALVNKIFNFIAIVPGLKFLNKLGGAIFGFLEGALFIGISLQFLAHLPISTPFATQLHNSTLAKYFLQLTAWLVPLFPQALKTAENAVNKVVPTK